MLVPAIVYKDELTKKYDLMRYSDEAIYYNGCIEFGRLQITDEPSEGRFQYGIINEKTNELVGYIAYYVDFYARSVWGIGLVSFDKKPNLLITLAVIEVMKQIESYNPHRVEFRAVEGNPAVKAYDKIRIRYQETFKWDANKIVLKDTFKDRQGNFRDSYIYEFVRREDED